MEKVKLSVSVSDSHRKRIAEVAKAAKKAGMKVENQLGEIGVLTGSIDAGRLSALRRVAGVEHVEEEREVSLPPSDSPVQ